VNLRLKDACNEIGIGHHQVRSEAKQLSGKSPNARGIIRSITKIDPNIGAFLPTELRKLIAERRDLCLPVWITVCICHNYADPPHALGLLRACCGRTLQ
jgi:hypothetical protein